jgi:hypothetical protein
VTYVYACEFSSYRMINYPNTWLSWLMPLMKNLCISKKLSWSVFNVGFWMHEAWKSVDTSPNVGKITWWSSTSFNVELVGLFHFSTSMNSLLQWIEFKVELTLLLNFFTDLIKHLVEHSHIRNRHKKQATLSIWKVEHNKVMVLQMSLTQKSSKN